MIDDRYIELMNGEVDGENSEKESAELKKYLEEHADARRYYEDLCAVARMFDEAGELNPPVGLRRAILSAVSRAKSYQQDKEKSLLSAAIGAFRLQFNRRYAYVFAAGVAVGICLLILLARIAPEKSPANFDDLYGTFVTGGRGPEVLAVVPVDFSLPGVSGSARVQYTRDKITVSLSLSAESQIRVVFEHNEDVRFESLRALESCDYGMHVASKWVELTHAGACGYMIVFDDGRKTHSSINMKILRGEGLLFERTIFPGPIERK